MAFKTATSEDSVPDSPDRLFRDLTRRKFPDVLPHQAETMQAYATQGVTSSDVALQLPTGSGKTLVGLLIAEWRRRKFNERVVYLCPTKQLVHQVVNQAEEKYGLSVGTFVGRQRDYSPASKADFQQAEKIAVTTYSGLFNTNSYFSSADVIVLDDAHAAENYVASFWSLRIAREPGEGHAALHLAICNLLSRHLTPTNLTRLRGTWEDVVDRTWVDMVPTPVLAEIKDELVEILDAHTSDTELRYPWSLLRGHLDACHVYLSTQDILIRPLLPPTFAHAPFNAAKQRIYMSATLGAGGDLERLTGRKNIHRIAAPKGWDTQGVGRRFFIFPEMSLSADETKSLRMQLMKRAGRSVVLVPSTPMANAASKQVTDEIAYPIYRVEDIESSKDGFVAAPEAVAIVANRYDGVDFSGDECRLLFIEGLPKAMNSQERFLMSRMAANTLYNERIQTRVVQAIGRCTRSLEDYSAVVVTGDDLPDYLSDIRRRKFFHPELQAEIDFGVRQSKDTDAANILENFDIFLKNGKAWESVNRTIVEARRRLHQESLPAIANLAAAVNFEIDYQAALWRADYPRAVGFAEQVLGTLTVPDVRGYRALWHYLAGSAASLGARAGTSALESKARRHFAEAYKCAPDIPWLTEFARRESPDVLSADAGDSALQQQAERMAAELSRLGSIHERKFASIEKEILEGLQDPDTFENAQVLLGNLLGFISGKEESEGSPDPWWISGDRCIVFEDYVNTTSIGALDVTKARQAASHPNWMRTHVAQATGCTLFPTLVSPATGIREAAVPHAKSLHYWALDDFLKWANVAVATVRELRATFFEQGDLVWQANAATMLKDRGLDIASVTKFLGDNMAVDCLRHV
ncbi:MAG: DEAD/DEAH box helicase [Rubrivivax sp.]|nr:DEAD/DEAH box helicase [Rubrivivax sp.]